MRTFLRLVHVLLIIIRYACWIKVIWKRSLRADRCCGEHGFLLQHNNKVLDTEQLGAWRLEAGGMRYAEEEELEFSRVFIKNRPVSKNRPASFQY